MANQQGKTGGGALLVDIGPIIAFFAAYKLTHDNIYVATGVIMIATVLGVSWSWIRSKKVRIMPMITLVLVMVFGTLTIVLHNPVFVKMKPTVIYSLFAIALASGAVTGNWYLKSLFEGSMDLPDRIWGVLTWRFVVFFVLLAGLNELVWRSFSEETWVDVKTFAFIPLTFLFGLANFPLVLKHNRMESEVPEDEGA